MTIKDKVRAAIDRWVVPGQAWLTASDADIARALIARWGAGKLPVVRHAVWCVRQERGIPVQPVECRRSQSSRAPKHIYWDAVDLGSRPDAEIAAEYGVAQRSVRWAREQRGIPVYDDAPRASTVNKGIDWVTIPLGHRPDSEIARELGVSVSTVHRARQRRGIPAYKED